MTRLLYLLLIVGMWKSSQADLCPSGVADAIDALLANCSVCQRAYWGLRVDQIFPSNGSSTTLAEINADKYLTPASNNKLLTTSVAFVELGLDYNITTPVYLLPTHDLCFSGRGDPTITMEDIDKLAAYLSSTGTSKVNNVIVDDTYWQGTTNLPQNWEWSDITQYWGAQPSPLILDENSITILLQPTKVGETITAFFQYESDAAWISLVITANTSSAGIASNIQVDVEPTDALTIYVSGTLPYGSGTTQVVLAAIDPAQRFARLLGDSLIKNNVTITGSVSVGACDAQASEHGVLLATLVSPPLSTMMNWTLQTSDNLYAETFLRHVGKLTEPEYNGVNTADLGMEEVRFVLTTKFGLESSSFSQDDGSGLSRHNLVSPDAIVDLLDYVYFMPNGQIYLSFLPTAGETGTLAGRYINTTAQGILHAKTGTLGEVNALSGFIDHNDPDYPILIFSMIVNHAAASSIPPIDEIGVLLSTVKNC